MPQYTTTNTPSINAINDTRIRTLREVGDRLLAAYCRNAFAAGKSAKCISLIMGIKMSGCVVNLASLVARVRVVSENFPELK